MWALDGLVSLSPRSPRFEGMHEPEERGSGGPSKAQGPMRAHPEAWAGGWHYSAVYYGPCLSCIQLTLTKQTDLRSGLPCGIRGSEND